MGKPLWGKPDVSARGGEQGTRSENICCLTQYTLHSAYMNT